MSSGTSGVALAPRTPGWKPWKQATNLWQRTLSHPQSINMLLLCVWIFTRAVLLVNLIVGQHYADPAFYNYGGELAIGHLPYFNYPVEYPPLAMLFILLPALPLLPLSGIAPLPVPELNGPSNLILNLPTPDPARYSAYGLSFAVEMLILDVVTLWLVRISARVLFRRREAELVAGLLYLGLIFASGALLQKFDLVVGTLTLAALLALWTGRSRTAWFLLALAVLVKGFPILLLPLFVAALVERSAPGTLRALARATLRYTMEGLIWCAGTVVVVTVAVIAWAGWRPVLETVTYHSSRGLEVESIYANVALVLGGLPGLEAITPFDADGLSRAVTSPITPAMVAMSTEIMALALLLVYLTYARGAWKRTFWPLLRTRTIAVSPIGTPATEVAEAEARLSTGEASGREAPPWAAAALLASLGLYLAFLATFRALPAHYLLDVIPLVPLVAASRPRLAFVWALGPACFAICGGLCVAAWNAFLAQEPWAVFLMTLRSVGWIGALVLVLSALWYGSVAEGSARVRAAPERVRQLAGRWRARWSELAAQAPPIPGFSPRGEDVFAHLLARLGAVPLLIGAGMGSLLCYGALVWAFPLSRWYNAPPVANSLPVVGALGPLTRYSPVAAVGLVSLVLALFVLQFLALVAVTRVIARCVDRRVRALTRGGVLLFPVFASAVVIWMEPVTSADLYGYVARGALFASGQGNPLTATATQLPGGLTIPNAAAPTGPAWLLLGWIVAHLAGENLLLSLVFYKVIVAAFMVASVLLVDALASHYFPTRRLRIDVLLGWSPLVLFETVGNGHNEIAIVLCVLLAFTCMARGLGRVAFMWLVLAALVNAVAVIFIPCWLVFEVRRRLTPRLASGLASSNDVRVGGRAEASADMRNARQGSPTGVVEFLASSLALGGAVTALCYAPFWHGPLTVPTVLRQELPQTGEGSIVSFLTSLFRVFTAPEARAAVSHTIQLVLACAFVVYVAWQLYILWRQPRLGLANVATVAAKIVFVGLIGMTFTYEPWYVVLLLPFAALATEPFVRRAALLLALGSLLGYAISRYLLVDQSGLFQRLVVQSVEVLFTFGPLLFLRAAPYEEGVFAVVRRYAGLLGRGLRVRTVWQERVMLALVLVVAAMLRLLRLGNLLSPLEGVGSSSDALAEVSGNLHLVLSDPRGLSLPFILAYQALVSILGPTPLAVLLPSAILGTLTVFVIYLLTREIMRIGGYRGSHLIGILAALLAATSRWHVALSRSGMEVVILPLLMCTALYWLLRALRLGAARSATFRHPDTLMSRPRQRRLRRAIAWRAIGAGICTGLACDLAPGLWVLPLLVIGVLAVWFWRRPAAFRGQPRLLPLLTLSAVVAGLPTVGYFMSQYIGLPAGSPILARSSVTIPTGAGPLSGDFWAQVGANLGTITRLLLTQDYSATYPAVGGAPIIPSVLTPVFVLGLILLLVRWRNLASLALLILLAMPILASVAVGTPASVIAAAVVLPAICIVPALALYEIFNALGHLPIVLDRMNGARVFSTPQQIGRVLLLLFLVVSTVRTFFWYFEATLPPTTSSVGMLSSAGVEPASSRLGAPGFDTRGMTSSRAESIGAVRTGLVRIIFTAPDHLTWVEATEIPLLSSK